MSGEFVHLHCHTEYSVLDGASKVGELIEKCREYGMPACAITDHGSLFGVIEFYKQAKEAGIKPIVGSELYVAKGDHRDRTGRSSNSHHFLLLCRDEEGYHNLCKLSTLGYLHGFHYKPRVDDALLAKYRGGLIATTGCLAAEVPQCLMNDDLDGARQAVEKYIGIYGKENFLVELQDHGIPEQQKINPMLAQLAEDFGLLLVATNDSHYVNQQDAEPHDALLCIQTNATIEQAERMRFDTDKFFFCDDAEMKKRFEKWPEAVTNTVKVAERCNLELPLGQHLIPKYVPPDGVSNTEYLRKLVNEGLLSRYGEDCSQEYKDRADFELAVIEQMGFVDYFLVVWDLIDFARKEGIPVGPGRGSGAGSIVAYALTITNIDPMRYDLLFERFLNPERVSMPDFDLDFCYQRREEIIEYVREKYGAENVSQIITFGRMLAKQVVRNVGRVMGMPYGDVDRIAKLIPDELKITLEKAMHQEPELKELVEGDQDLRKLWRLATRLEGTIGTVGTHAAGVVICDEPLVNHVALFKASGSDVVATQVEMAGVEDVGLLKMDFLGLRTLTVVHDAVRMIKENHGVEIDIDHLEPNDEAVYKLLRSGQTMGIFQLESAGMRDLSRRIGLESLEEICALVALYRPGPMALKEQYIENKLNHDSVTYAHPLLEPILEETYGIALYQEQVMQIVQAVAGFTLGQADILRRAMGKKKTALMAEQRDKFIEGCKKTNDIDEKTAESLFQNIETFAGYGFNKSHSMAYAYVAYQTAYLKAHFPAEFMAALLSSESRNLDKVGVYMEECRRMGLEVRPPDVNASEASFSVDNGAIVFGLSAVRNVGGGPADAIVREREENGPFRDVYDFCGRLESRYVNRRIVESLNRAGAFVSTGWNRRQVADRIEHALQEAQSVQKDRAAGQASLLDLLGDEAEAAKAQDKPDVPEWTEKEILAAEKEMMGLYVTSHPLLNHAKTFEHFSSARLDDIYEMEEDTEIIIGGMVSAVKTHMTSRGDKMAFITLETLEGSREMTIFADTYGKRRELIVEESIVMIIGRVNYRNDEPGIIVEDVMPVHEAEDRLTRALHVRVNADVLSNGAAVQLAEVLGENPGHCDVYVHCLTEDRDEVTVHATSTCRVAASPELKAEVAALIGDDAVWWSGANGLPVHNNSG